MKVSLFVLACVFALFALFNVVNVNADKEDETVSVVLSSVS